ncbi:MAG: LysR family transcriptional regulator [Pseudomonadota bacterium]
MPDLRDMQLLTSLARHNHFARAAEECGISQPAFSTRIRNLERELGAPVVKRGNRFMGFTREGEIVLTWARRIMVDLDSLRQELEAARGAFTGRLSVGAVPTALAFVAQSPMRLRQAHPDLLIHIKSLSSSQIHQGLADFSLDAGVTYLDHELPPGLTADPLYEERYVLIASVSVAPRSDGPITWAEAATLPLCLLTRAMRNRRILDEVFEQAVGARPSPVMETNAFTAALAQVATGAAATIAPAHLAESLEIAGDVVRLPLIEPEVRTPIGLVTTDRDPVPPAVSALVEALKAASR